MKILFFGTPPFAAKVLDFLIRSGIEVAAVVTRQDKPRGRSGESMPSAVKEEALKRGLPLLQPEKASSPESVEALKKFGADLFVVVAYGEIVRDEVLKAPPLGCINLHASLLPKYRGAAPIQRAIMAGEEKTGVSIIRMVRKMDAGDVILKREIEIGQNETYGELSERLIDAGQQALYEAIQLIFDKKAEEVAQEESLVTFAEKIELEECEVNFEKDAKDVHNLIRGTNPEPGAFAWVEWKGKKLRLKIFLSEIAAGYQGRPGEIVGSGREGVIVACGSGALRLKEVQLEGKRRMGAADLFRGAELIFCTN